MLAICLTAVSPWPRKATHGCFYVFARYRTKSDRHVLRRMILKTKKKSYRSTDYQVPTYRVTKWNTCFSEKSKVITILTYIHMISYEYEYFGSSRTPVTKSSMHKRPHRILVLLHTRSKHPTLLAKMSFDEILDLTAVVFLFHNCYRETIHVCSYTRERIMSPVSLYSSILWVSHTVNNGMRAADGSGDTLGVQKKAPSRSMRYLVKIPQINFMLSQKIRHHLLVRIHIEKTTRRGKKAPHAPMDLWLTCQRLAWSF